MPIDRTARIYVAGHLGMVGSAIVRRLRALGATNLVLRARAELDLTDQAAVRAFLRSERPDYIFVAAARVGGILANDSRRADFIFENLAISLNLVHGAFEAGVERMLYLGSSCVYPRDCPQPMREAHLLTGPLEPTNEPYAVAKIAGIKLCESFNRQHGTRYLAAMPTNLYGPGDNYDPRGSHVVPGLIRRMHEAKRDAAPEVLVWGTGTPRREFLHCDDAADACVHLMLRHDEALAACGEGTPIVNVGCGEDLTIRELADLVREVVGYAGAVAFDPGKPDGAPVKRLDVSRLSALGWHARIALREGLADACADFRARVPS